jgi:mono/diheme cytochrome c family protein
MIEPSSGLSTALLMSLCLMLAAPAASAGDDVSRGREIFTEIAAPQCGICHTLADAGSEGEIGPNLDDLKPSEDQVRRAVTDGIEAMPSYRDSLEQDDIAAVARYVASIAGQP